MLEYLPIFPEVILRRGCLLLMNVTRAHVMLLLLRMRSGHGGMNCVASETKKKIKYL